MRFAERLWIMVDVETSGPVYGTHSMVELGAAVGSRERGVLDRFSALLRPAGEAVEQSRETTARARLHGQDPALVMAELVRWARPHQDARGTFLARPAAFDWPWIVHYCWTFLGANPLGFKAVCASSWLESRGKRFDVKLPHVAVEDAEIQLRWFLEHG